MDSSPAELSRRGFLVVRRTSALIEAHFGQILTKLPERLHQQLTRNNHEHPVVEPQVLHFRQVPLRTSVKLPHSPQLSPT